jgi:hypothetical protein
MEEVMMHLRWGASWILAVAVVIGLTAMSGAEEPAEKFRQTFAATAVAMGTSNPPIIPSGRSATVDINITRWTTDAEREALFGVLAEEGQKGLIPALRKQQETGWIRVTGPSQRGSMTTFPSERFRYARQMTMENGSRRVVLALDRPISMYEATRRPRWREYDMTLLVMDLDAEGKGSGQLAIGVQLELDAATNTLVIENFGTEPVRLLNVRQTR